MGFPNASVHRSQNSISARISPDIRACRPRISYQHYPDPLLPLFWGGGPSWFPPGPSRPLVLGSKAFPLSPPGIPLRLPWCGAPPHLKISPPNLTPRNRIGRIALTLCLPAARQDGAPHQPRLARWPPARTGFLGGAHRRADALSGFHPAVSLAPTEKRGSRFVPSSTPGLIDEGYWRAVYP